MKQQISGSPSVSVIMPAYNAARFVGEAVASILNQSFTDFEFIIVNDGSTDDTSKILHSYQDSRIHLIERENKGFAASLNEAIAISRGKYIARMDADDIALNNRLQLQYEYMEANENVGILGGQAYLIDEQGEKQGETNNPLGREEILSCLEYICPMTHPTYFVRKEVYEKTRGYRHLPPVEDYDFLLRATELDVEISNLADKVILYRSVFSGMSLGNPQRGIELKGEVQKMHKLRVAGRNDAELFDAILKKNINTTTWFQLVYYLKDRLSCWKNKCRGVPRYLLYAPIILVSMMHYKLFMFEYSYFKALMIRHKLESK